MKTRLGGTTTRTSSALLAVALAGCGTLLHLGETLTSRDRSAALKPYAGARRDLRVMGLSPLYTHVGVGWIGWLALLDLPFSFVADTALLPITGPAWLLGVTSDEEIIEGEADDGKTTALPREPKEGRAESSEGRDSGAPTGH